MAETYNSMKEAIRAVRKRLGMTQSAFAEAFGVTPAAVSAWESGASVPGASSLSILLRAYGAQLDRYENEQVTVTYVKDSPGVYRAPNVGAVIESQQTGDVIVPVLLQDAHAGTPHPVVTDESESFNVTKHYRDTIVVRVVGDSMIDAGIDDGDRVVIRRTTHYKDGDIALAQVDGEVFLKAIFGDGERILFVPANSKYESWSEPAKDVKIIGVAMEIIRRTRRITKPGGKKR